MSYPSIPPLDSVSTLKINSGCSERTGNSYTQPFFNSSLFTWPRVSCPHLQPDLVALEDTNYFNAGDPSKTLTIPSGSKILLRPCSIPSSFEFVQIFIQSNASLVFDDAPISLFVREIVIETGGSLLIGSENCRLYSSINITFPGRKNESSLVDFSGNPSKGILSRGRLEIHGRLFQPTWTRLARTAAAGANFIYLQDSVNWPIGSTILIVTSIFYDCPTKWQDYCRPCWDITCTSAPITHQNEIRRVRGIFSDPYEPSGSLILLDSPLTNLHYGGYEYQSEVAILSRTINLRGVDYGDNTGFGGHTKSIGTSAIAKISGVAATFMGQLNVLGRYPFHLHMMGNGSNSIQSYFQDCSVIDSQFRAYVIHGTNSSRISRNIAYNVNGNGYYLEDGVEENNLLEYNLAAFVHPIFRPARGPNGQSGEYFEESPNLIIPADTSASGFYALNANNRYIGNAASGGWAGFAFPNAPVGIGNFKGIRSASNGDPYAPYSRPLLEFRGNSAHSSGFYWLDHPGGVYCGKFN